MSQNFFGDEWKKYAPHPIFNEWLPFTATIVGLISSIIGLAVALLSYERMKGK